MLMVTLKSLLELIPTVSTAKILSRIVLKLNDITVGSMYKVRVRYSF